MHCTPDTNNANVHQSAELAGCGLKKPKNRPLSVLLLIKASLRGIHSPASASSFTSARSKRIMLAWFWTFPHRQFNKQMKEYD